MAFIFGLISVVLIGKLSLGALAVIFGLAAHLRILRSGGTQGGATLAALGIALGIVGLAMACLSHGPVSCMFLPVAW